MFYFYSKKNIVVIASYMIMTTANAFDFSSITKSLEIVQEVVQTQATTPENKEQSAKPNYLRLGLGTAATLLKNTTHEEEYTLGRTIAGRLLGAVPLVEDDELQNYVNKVGLWVALQSERPELNWTFGVIDSETVNAFSVPGGYIFLTKGLYRKLHNESELAGILGHEISHVVKKHHLNILKQAKLLDTGARIGAAELNTKDKVFYDLIGNGAEILSRGLDKGSEYEADQMGVILSARAGYNAYGLPLVLQEIGHTSNSASVELLFKTHPKPQDRIEELDTAMGDFNDEGLYLDERFYHLN